MQITLVSLAQTAPGQESKKKIISSAQPSSHPLIDQYEGSDILDYNIVDKCENFELYFI